MRGTIARYLLIVLVLGLAGSANAGELAALGGVVPLDYTDTSVTFYGYWAGHSTTGDYDDTFIGAYAGALNTTGYKNTFLGYYAGYHNMIGSGNTFLGESAGHDNITGANNTFLGTEAGYWNTSSGNTFVGFYTGWSNTSGSNNTFLGFEAGYNITTGSNNTFLGYLAGPNTISSNNTFVGEVAGYSNTSGSNSTFLGYRAGYWNTTGSSNTFLGNGAGENNYDASNNTFVGNDAGGSNTSGSNNTFVGLNAGYSNDTASSNTFLGTSAGYTNSTGGFNTFVGTSAGYNNTASNNTFVGYEAGTSNTTGYFNTFLGYRAGNSNTGGYYNTFLGYRAGYSTTTGSTNTFLGYGAGYSTTGGGNVFLGYQAGSNETGSDKLYIDNSNTNAPLIYGEFDNNILKINGRLGVGRSPGASYQLDVNGTVNATSFVGNGSGLTNLTELDPKVGTLTAGAWCTSNGTIVSCTQTAPVVAEVDPKVGSLTASKWCTSDGSHVNCSQDAPVTTDKVGSNTANYVPRWNGTALVSGSIYDDGVDVGVNANFNVVRVAGADDPAYTVDVSNHGVSRSALHFSLSGTDTGGWITSVADNNFWLSSGAMWDNAAGGWVQKSPDMLAVMAGSGPAGYRVITRSGCAVGTVCPATTRMRIDYNGYVGFGVVPTHPLHLAGGAYSDGAAWFNGSSREYKENIRDLTTEEALGAFSELNPVAFTYKTGGGEQHIGFIAEDVPDLVATKDRKGLSPMDIVAVLTKVVKEQQGMINELSIELKDLKRELRVRDSVAREGSPR